MNKTTFSDRLLAWFDQHGRKDLPWQMNKTPYRVWVSEIMLQQTQVASVIQYYARFMKSFPDVESLANAHEDAVLEHWAGLGYYARARNLHKTAKIVANEKNGKFPEDVTGLCELPGIGRSTAGAITSIALKKRAPILDGNVKRVLCRFNAVETWPGERETEKTLWQLAEDLTPHARVDDYTQAIMDLGATLCTRSKPDCLKCPMQDKCMAFKLGRQAELPKSKPRKTIPTKETWLLHIEDNNGQLLLEKRPPKGIWGGLYSLPEAPFELTFDELEYFCKNQLGIELLTVDRQKMFTHVFSHYKLNIHPVVISTKQIRQLINDNDRMRWFEKNAIENIGLPAPVEKYLKQTIQPELALNP